MKITNEVYNMDCWEFMRSCPDNYYDFVIADPWYGIGMTKNDTTGFAKRRFKTLEKNGINPDRTDERPPRSHFETMKRVSKNQIIWGGNYFLDYLGNCRAPIIWDKQTGENYFADGEMAWTSFGKGCLRIFRHQWCGCFKDSERGEKMIHSCQKPVALYEWLIDKYMEPGMRLFSPYVGSGSDRIAAYKKGIFFEGCEIDPGHWENQEDRFRSFLDPVARLKRSIKEDERKGQPNLFDSNWDKQLILL